MHRTVSLLLTTVLFAVGCSTVTVVEEQRLNDERFPLEPHLILPVWFPSNAHRGAGVVDGVAPDQPIPFSHWLHAGKNEISCQYCHHAARKGPHGGAPEVQVCMQCHTWVKTESPHIKLVTEHYENGDPIQWQKVHDLPDYVNFAHVRHVKAGVECTECHGQVKLQGEPTYETRTNEAGEEYQHLSVEKVMVRESTLQMGWCLDCHAGHPSVDENYGENAGTRRAELKDCWTCHK